MFRDEDVICNSGGLLVAGTLSPLEVWIHFLSLRQGSRDKGILYAPGTAERGVVREDHVGWRVLSTCCVWFCLLLLTNSLLPPRPAPGLHDLECPGPPSLSQAHFGCWPHTQYKLSPRCSRQTEVNSSQSQNWLEGEPTLGGMWKGISDAGNSSSWNPEAGNGKQWSRWWPGRL